MSVKSIEDVDNLVERLMGGGSEKGSAVRAASSAFSARSRPEKSAKNVFLGVGATMEMLKASTVSQNEITRDNTEEEKRLERTLFSKRKRKGQGLDEDEDDFDIAATHSSPKHVKKVKATAVATPLGKRIKPSEISSGSETNSDSEDEDSGMGSRSQAVKTGSKNTPVKPISAPLLEATAKLEAQKEHQREKRRQKRMRKKEKEEVKSSEEAQAVLTHELESDSAENEVKSVVSDAKSVIIVSKTKEEKNQSKRGPDAIRSSHPTTETKELNQNKSKAASLSEIQMRPETKDVEVVAADTNPKTITQDKITSSVTKDFSGASQSLSVEVKPAIKFKGGYKAPIGFDESRDSVKPRTYREHLVPIGEGKVLDKNTGQKLRIKSDGRIKTKKRSKQKNIRKDRRSDELKPQGESRRQLTEETMKKLSNNWE